MARALSHSYGKEAVSVYRIHGGRLFAAEVAVELHGGVFLRSYTEGDNSMVVATDSLKNFVHAHALEYEGDSLEGLLELLGRRLLDRYDHVDRVSLRARDVPVADQSNLVLQRICRDRAVADMTLDRSGVVDHRSGIADLRLLKLGGSSFAGFVRDEYTTLPDAHDRPLFVWLDARWRYRDFGRRVDGDRVRTVLVETFAQLDSRSIQHLVHEMGRRVLDGFGEIDEIEFEAQNRLWDRAGAAGGVAVYTDARPPYGLIRLTVAR